MRDGAYIFAVLILVQEYYCTETIFPFAHLTGVFFLTKLYRKDVGPDVIFGLRVLGSMRVSGHVALKPQCQTIS
jgi:hypothetical protein